MNLKDFMITNLIQKKTSSLQECITTVNPVLDDVLWSEIIDGIGSGKIEGYQDLMQYYGLDVKNAMAIWENRNLMTKIGNVLVNQAKTSLLTSGVSKLKEIYKQEGDIDQAISAIDKLAKIVNVSEEKKESGGVNIQFNLESVLRATKNKKVIDI